MSTTVKNHRETEIFPFLDKSLLSDIYFFKNRLEEVKCPAGTVLSVILSRLSFGLCVEHLRFY